MLPLGGKICQLGGFVLGCLGLVVILCCSNCTYMCVMLFYVTNKEKHSLTRKLVGYRNWRQKWCGVKRKGTRFWVKDSKTKILYLALLLVQLHLHVLNIGFLSHYPFPKTLFCCFLHHFCLQFLYPTNFLVRERFSLLFPIIVDICNTG